MTRPDNQMHSVASASLGSSARAHAALRTAPRRASLRCTPFQIDLTKLSLAIALCAAISTNLLALADSNSFFGTNASGSGSGSGSSSGSSSSKQGAPDVDETNINAGLPGLTAPPAMPPAGDYTDDEKRVQRKYKGNIAHAKQLIAKGEGMMKSAPKDGKEYKKGKILKETGEKWLSELKANDPYANEKPVAAGADAKESGQKK